MIERRTPLFSMTRSRRTRTPLPRPRSHDNMLAAVPASRASVAPTPQRSTLLPPRAFRGNFVRQPLHRMPTHSTKENRNENHSIQRTCPIFVTRDCHIRVFSLQRVYRTMPLRHNKHFTNLSSDPLGIILLRFGIGYLKTSNRFSSFRNTFHVNKL